MNSQNKNHIFNYLQQISVQLQTTATDKDCAYAHFLSVDNVAMMILFLAKLQPNGYPSGVSPQQSYLTVL
jgi:hypothetical protein